MQKNGQQPHLLMYQCTKFLFYVRLTISLYMLETFEELPLYQWVIENKKRLGYLFLACVALILWVGRWQTQQTQQEQQQLFAMPQMLKTLQSTDSASTDQKIATIQQLHHSLKKYPHFAPFYDAPAAQLLLLQDHTPQALPFAEASLARASHQLPSAYTQYAQVSLALAQGNIAESLVDTENAYHSFTDKERSPALYAATVSRLAALHQIYGDKTKAKTLWEEWRRLQTK